MQNSTAVRDRVMTGIQHPERKPSVLGSLSDPPLIAQDPPQIHGDIQIISFSGRSGSGKNRLAKELQKLYSDMNLIRSFTTRELRAGQDEEYRHVDREEFLQLIENGEFLWNTDPEISHGNLYGTLRCDIEEALSHRCPSLIHVTPHTIHHLREYERARARVFSVYVNVEDEDLLRKRLEARDPDEVPAYYEERIVKCRGWKEFAGTSGRFNMCIENDGRYHLREIMEELLHNLTRPIGFPVSF